MSDALTTFKAIEHLSWRLGKLEEQQSATFEDERDDALHELFTPPVNGWSQACRDLIARRDNIRGGFVGELVAKLKEISKGAPRAESAGTMYLDCLNLILTHLSGSPSLSDIERVAKPHAAPMPLVRDMVHEISQSPNALRPISKRLVRFPVVVDGGLKRRNASSNHDQPLDPPKTEALVTLRIEVFYVRNSQVEFEVKPEDWLYPASSMTAIEFDREWNTAVLNAGSHVRSIHFDRIVKHGWIRWSIEMADPDYWMPWRFAGGSCGGAFGLALLSALEEAVG